MLLKCYGGIVLYENVTAASGTLMLAFAEGDLQLMVELEAGTDGHGVGRPPAVRERVREGDRRGVHAGEDRGAG